MILYSVTESENIIPRHLSPEVAAALQSVRFIAQHIKDAEKDNEPAPSAQELKSEGNERVKEEKFAEAVLLYTRAIKLEPKNHTLYSNRSFTFLRLSQHYLALQDANETIRLEPQWPKGYFRRAEVEAASGLYEEAIVSYGRALQLQPHDTTIIDAIKRITQLRRARINDNQNIIWLSTCVGLIIGISIVVSDYMFTEKPSLTNPFVMVIFALMISGGGWGIGKCITLMRNWSAGKTLMPPEGLDLPWKAGPPESEQQDTKRPAKYSKAQARHRYKQGKL